VQKQTLDEVGN